MIGGGVPAIAASPTDAIVTTTAPTDGPNGDGAPNDSWLGRVRNTTGDEKFIKTFAICSTRGTYTRHVQSASLPDNTQRSAQARCPGDSKVLSGGVELSSAAAGLSMKSSYPSGRGTKWTGVASNSGTGSSFSFDVYAICAARGHYAYRSASSSGAFGSGVSCPIGSQLVGGGIQTFGSSLTRAIYESRPGDGTDSDTAEDDAWFDGVDRLGAFKVLAVCKTWLGSATAKPRSAPPGAIPPGRKVEMAAPSASSCRCASTPCWPSASRQIARSRRSRCASERHRSSIVERR